MRGVTLVTLSLNPGDRSPTTTSMSLVVTISSATSVILVDPPYNLEGILRDSRYRHEIDLSGPLHRHEVDTGDASP